MTSERTSPIGIILAGGRSRRMAGVLAEGRGDKGLLDLGGKPMIAHVIERLAPQTGDMVINANGDPGRFSVFGLPVIADELDGHPGPLAGILAGLRWSAVHAPGATHVLTVSADAPFLPHDLGARLDAALRGDPAARIALATSAGETHSVIGLWPVALADELDAALRSGTRKVLAWAEQQGVARVAFPFAEVGGQHVDPFFNANTPEDLAEARWILAQSLEGRR